MYGGHVISIVRALSFNGLANALRIAAINAGTHCNPSFAGDTVYAWTEVLERWDLSGRTDLGALRLRTVGVRNTTTEGIADAKVEKDGRRVYRDEVVLDLDYTVLMPRRR
jgi:2-methylfumaryl-CoA hydratase